MYCNYKLYRDILDFKKLCRLPLTYFTGGINYKK